MNKTRTPKQGRLLLPGAALALVLGISILLGSCATEQLSLKTSEKAAKVVHTDTMMVKAEFLTKQEVRDRYGMRLNPFVARPFSAIPLRFFVLQVTIQAKKPMQYRLTETRLNMEGSTYQAINEFQLSQYWKNIDENEELSYSAIRKKQRIISTNIMKSEASLAPGQTLRGVVLFRGNIPVFGTAKVYFPALDPAGQVIDRAEVRYEF